MGATAFCRTSAECATNERCDNNTCICDLSTHRCGDACVSNSQITSCGQRCEPCLDDANGLASCVDERCTNVCNEGFHLCENDKGCSFTEGSCVECERDNECEDPKKPTCDDQGQCVACQSDQDCSIDRPVCDSGSCEVCSGINEIACGGKTCDPSTSECTTIGVGAQGECEACVSDSQCGDGLFCVPMKFKETDLPGGYCLKRSDLNGCPSPYTTVLVDRVSLSGKPADRYCGPDEMQTTCKGVLDYNGSCAKDDDCGIPGIDDAICAPVEFEFAHCSFHCSASNQCPSVDFGCWRDQVDPWWCGGF